MCLTGKQQQEIGILAEETKGGQSPVKAVTQQEGKVHAGDLWGVINFKSNFLYRNFYKYGIVISFTINYVLKNVSNVFKWTILVKVYKNVISRQTRFQNDNNKQNNT